MNVSSLFAPKDVPSVSADRKARLTAARRTNVWTEEQEAMFVERNAGRWRYFVHAETDELYKLYAGVVFAIGSATIIADHPVLTYFADEDGNLTFLEKAGGTWSALYAKLCEREAARR